MATGNGSRQLRRYSLRTERDKWLAEVVISDDGYFSTVSDYGNYAFYWSHAGDCSRTFLAKIGEDYMLSKLCGRRSEYDGDRTLASVKEYIVDNRRDGGFSKEDARKEWDLLDEHSDLDSREQFYIWVSNTSIGDAYEMAVYDYPSDALGFAEKVMPVLKAKLLAEICTEHEARGAGNDEA